MLKYSWDGQESIAGIRALRNRMNIIDLRQKPQIYSRTHRAMMQMGMGLIAVCIMASLLPLYLINYLSKRLQLVIEAAKEVGEATTISSCTTRSSMTSVNSAAISRRWSGRWRPRRAISLTCRSTMC